MSYFHPETDYAPPWDTTDEEDEALEEFYEEMAATRTRKKIDPFASDDATDTKENETVTETPAVETDAATGEITLTFKAGSGFEVPWIVVRTPDLASASDVLENQSDVLKEVMEKTARAGAFFASQMPAAAPRAAAAGNNAPAATPARQQAPGGQSRQCKHGEMQYRSGSKNGRTWEAFMCPTPKGTPDQCRAEFL